MSRYDEFDDGDSWLGRTARDVSKGFGLRHIVMVVGVLGLGALLLGAGGKLFGAHNGGTSGNVPLVEADNTPYKSAPDDAGGMAVPNQSSTIFDTLKGQDGSKVENLLADDEQPMTKAEIAPPPSNAGLTKPEAEPDTTASTTASATEQTPAQLATEKQVEGQQPNAQQQVAMVDPKAETAKPETMPTPPLDDTVASTEPSAQAAAKEPTASVKDAPKEPVKKEEVKKEEPKAEPKQEAKPETKGSTSIQFAAVKSDDEARKLWASLQSKNPELLGKILRVQKADLKDKGVFYRVQVGGFSADSASSICAKVKSRGGSCMVVK